MEALCRITEYARRLKALLRAALDGKASPSAIASLRPPKKTKFVRFWTDLDDELVRVRGQPSILGLPAPSRREQHLAQSPTSTNASPASPLCAK